MNNQYKKLWTVVIMQQQAENSWFFTKPDPDLEGAAEESLEDPIQAAGEVIKDEIAMTTFTGIDPFPEMLKGENLAGIDKYVHRPEAKD